VKWTGLQEFKNALKNLPAELTEEAGAIVVSHAYEAERLVEGVYPIRTTNTNPGPNRKSRWTPPGNLRKGVRTTVENSSRFGASATVRSGAQHSHLFEKGTGTRRTSSGANRGRMPAAPPNQQMIPIVIRVRRRMVTQLIQMVQKAGLVVTES